MRRDSFRSHAVDDCNNTESGGAGAGALVYLRSKSVSEEFDGNNVELMRLSIDEQVAKAVQQYMSYRNVDCCRHWTTIIAAWVGLKEQCKKAVCTYLAQAETLFLPSAITDERM